MIIVLYLLVLIGGLALMTFGLSLIGHKRYQKRVEEGTAKEDETSPFEITKEVPDECCGQHATCERDSLLAAVSKEIIYYDDEELDQFKGVSSDEYTADQTEEFAQIFYELKEVEVAGWCRSLQLRGIELPDDLKDEVLMVVRERRFQSVAKDGTDHSNERVRSKE
ncbi:MAG: phospholipase [Bacteroidales bacterium]|nr:phospholipase [Candidatus Liminaster caballi]